MHHVCNEYNILFQIFVVSFFWTIVVLVGETIFPTVEISHSLVIWITRISNVLSCGFYQDRESFRNFFLSNL